MTQQANPDYHDGYECAEKATCVGELRHELLTDPMGDMLPDESPVSFEVHLPGGYSARATIDGGGVTQLKATLDLALDHLGMQAEPFSFSSLCGSMSDEQRSIFLDGWLASMGLQRCEGKAVMDSDVMLAQHSVYLFNYHDAVEMRTVGTVVGTWQVSDEPDDSVMVDWGDDEPVRCAQHELICVETLQQP